MHSKTLSCDLFDDWGHLLKTVVDASLNVSTLLMLETAASKFAFDMYYSLGMSSSSITA